MVAFSDYRKARALSEGSWIGRWIWCAILLTAACCAGAFAYATYSVQSDATAPISWDAAVTGTISHADESLINGQVDRQNQAVLYAAMGDFSQVSSDTVTKRYPADDEDKGALSGELQNLYPVNAPIGGDIAVQGFQLVSTYGNDSLIASPWFSENDLVEGTLNNANPVIVDAYTAAEFEVHPGSKITVKARTGKDDEETSEKLVVTGIVRPTKRFTGICAQLPAIQKALEKSGQTTVDMAYVYGMKGDSATSFVNAVNNGLSDKGSTLASLPSQEVANEGVKQWTDVPSFSPWYVVIFLLAAALLVSLLVIDARRTGNAMREEGLASNRGFYLYYLGDGIAMWLVACFVAQYFFSAFTITGSIYFIWYLLPYSFISLAIVIGGAALAAVLRLIFVRHGSATDVQVSQ
ncbi:MAG: hypothetical protein ACOX12_01265 [Eggerthellaceae bacterium]|jgi:flavin-binding protein dodecin